METKINITDVNWNELTEMFEELNELKKLYNILYEKNTGILRLSR